MRGSRGLLAHTHTNTQLGYVTRAFERTCVARGGLRYLERLRQLEGTGIAQGLGWLRDSDRSKAKSMDRSGTLAAVTVWRPGAQPMSRNDLYVYRARDRERMQRESSESWKVGRWATV